MIVMAIEAANQLANANLQVKGFQLREVEFLSALVIPVGTVGIETHLHLRQVKTTRV